MTMTVKELISALNKLPPNTTVELVLDEADHPFHQTHYIKPHVYWEFLYKDGARVVVLSPV